MNMITVIVLAIFIVVVVAFALWWSSRRQRTEKLRQHFGPEYDRAVEQYGAEGRAEKELQGRAERVEQLHITPLSPADSSRYAAEWRDVQALFVDDPQVAIGEADRLVGTVMQARGYPMGDFEQRAADISVDHPVVLENYRAAHAIAVRDSQSGASTEDFRQGMVHYRALFEELLDRRVREEVRR